MAWIESHQELETHPKTLSLMTMMDWDIDTTIGKLHRFWYWCAKYAEDGDLRKFNDNILAGSVGLNSSVSKKFVDSMVNCGFKAESGFIDRDPYFRLHDWWTYYGKFLQAKYRQRPEMWHRVRDMYVMTKSLSNTMQPNQPNQPNLTKETEPSAVSIEKAVDKPITVHTDISPELKSCLDKAAGLGFNAYACINKLKGSKNWTKEIPDQVLINVCNQYLRDKAKGVIKSEWPWFTKVFEQESQKYFASQQVEEHRVIKGQPSALKDIMSGIGK